LLVYGADIDQASGNLGTALEIATQRAEFSEWSGYDNIVDRLLEWGARLPAPMETEEDEQQ
jgi:hypothetical protein